MNLSAITKASLVASFLLPSFALPQDSAQTIYAKASPAIAFIKTDKGAGTGFFALTNGTLFTAFHVIDGAPSVVTLKPAICGHFKTGHSDWPKT
jgi:hypothetical protein